MEVKRDKCSPLALQCAAALTGDQNVHLALSAMPLEVIASSHVTEGDVLQG